ncbi:hypothetical protein GCM10007231_08720 [Nocardioides daphniae]|uniref:SGNH hydrolase-type esterase domain-containing protein n=1 Tax=Nocardioides daphniae TaxID=402297 RepID=A0ABQ1Q3F0_9ACTN|nr:hypothetical protein GCM10007231_08720 [Nocardioides daphniae]
MTLPLLAPFLAVLLVSPASHAAPAGSGLPPIWERPGGERYVSFGDSFVAGPLINPQRLDSGACLRSKRNFPTVVAETLDVNAFTDASCSGAVVEDLYVAQGANPPQLDSLSRSTSLVSFGTIGGNDIGLVGLATGCLLLNCVPPAGTDPLGPKFAQVEVDLLAAVRETQRRAPRADVLVVGYGTYLPPGGCPTVIPGLSAAEADYVQGQIDRLSDLLAEVAAATGSIFVDQRTIPGAIDHTACAAPDQQWIRAISTYGDGAPLHPSAAGMAATAAHVVATLAQARGTTVEQIRRDALRRKARSLELDVSCRLLGTVLRTEVTGGRGAVAQVDVRVGERLVSSDTTAPWVTATATTPLRTTRGPVRATVTLRDGALELKRRFTAGRPRCL